MNTAKLINKAFDWYYEENMHITNINNEEITQLFESTEIFKDYELANGNKQIESNCAISDVSVSLLNQIKQITEEEYSTSERIEDIKKLLSNEL